MKTSKCRYNNKKKNTIKYKYVFSPPTPEIS